MWLLCITGCDKAKVSGQAPTVVVAGVKTSKWPIVEVGVVLVLLRVTAQAADGAGLDVHQGGRPRGELALRCR